MGNASRKSTYPKSVSSGGSETKKVRWGVGLGVPSPPGKPLLIPGEEDSDPDTVGIRWERSPSNGGTAIIGYIVEHRKMGSPNWVRSAPFLCSYPELILSGLDPGWRYQFRVKAQNAVGLSDPSEISDPLTVTLQRAAAISPQFETELKDVVALENDQVEFAVSFIGSPTPKIAWFKDGFEIFSSRRTKIITENGRSNLLIYRIALDDEGEIKCTATNRAGHVSTKAKLILEAPPRIRLPRQYEDGLLFEQDETIRLKVSLAGKPAPAVSWYHDGEPILPDKRHVFDHVDGESSMKIPDAKRQDRGEYTVRAINKLGEDVSSFLVTVTDRPAAPEKIIVTMTLGRSVTLAWKEPEDDGGCKIGTYIIEYYRVGWNMWLKAATSRQLTTTLNELIEGSEYRFRVKAENPYGVSDPSEESDTVFIPDPKRGILSASMLEKSQSSREIHRGRHEKREVSFIEPSQRTRSLTRDETSSKRPERSKPPLKPPRTDSRVTFALDTVYSEEKSTEKPTHVPPKEAELNKKDIESTQSEFRPMFTRMKSPDIILTPSTLSKEEELQKDRVMSYKEPLESSSISKVSTQFLTPVASETKVETGQKSTADRKRAFSNIRSKSADDTDTLYSLEGDESMMNGSSEFMLVLYPKDNNLTTETENRTTSQVESVVDKKTKTEDKSESQRPKSAATDDDEDLVPPPMSFSLPELFSINHEIIEVIREAVSSTELLHEKAMERFYRAVAAEEATNQSKRQSTTKTTTTDDDVNITDTYDSKILSFRRRLSNSGVQASMRQVKKERRKSNEDPNVIMANQKTKLPSSGTLKSISSDPNLFLNKITPTKEKLPLREPEKLLSRTDKVSHSKEHITFQVESKDIQADESIPSSEEDYDEMYSDEGIEDLKKRILSMSIAQENDTYHPVGMSKPHEDTSDTVVPQSTPQIIPKSILKKRVETEPVPVTQFGRPIPPEVPVERPVVPPVESQPTVSTVSTQQNYNLMSDLEKDSITVLSAAEAAKDKRKQFKQSSSSSSFNAENEEKLAEERMAVVSHYTEIVKEYSMAHSPFPPRSSSRQGTPTATTSHVQEVPSPIHDRQRIPSVSQPVHPVSPSPSFSQPNLIKPVPTKIISPAIIKAEEIPVASKIIIPIPKQQIIADPVIENTLVLNNKTVSQRSRDATRDVAEASSGSSSQTRRSSRQRSPSQTRRSSRQRSPSQTKSTPQSRSSSVSRSRARSSSRTRSKAQAEVTDSAKKSLPQTTRERRPSRTSRQSSRANSRDRSQVRNANDKRIEYTENVSNVRSNEPVITTSDVTLNYVNNNIQAVQKQADLNVRKLINFITDLALLLAAVYVYLFKREICALPFVILLLYRHIQKEIKNLIPRWIYKPRDS